ncbi:hypothetical protein OH77DRAFT_1004929 [Trametes cingulata]|nr:hypothetical protein OH77DRAFT_1004929 [Trametes cingulata]
MPTAFSAPPSSRPCLMAIDGGGARAAGSLLWSRGKPGDTEPNTIGEAAVRLPTDFGAPLLTQGFEQVLGCPRSQQWLLNVYFSPDLAAAFRACPRLRCDAAPGRQRRNGAQGQPEPSSTQIGPSITVMCAPRTGPGPRRCMRGRERDTMRGRSQLAFWDARQAAAYVRSESAPVLRCVLPSRKRCELRASVCPWKDWGVASGRPDRALGLWTDPLVGFSVQKVACMGWLSTPPAALHLAVHGLRPPGRNTGIQRWLASRRHPIPASTRRRLSC